MKFELSREDFEVLMVALGIAAGACRGENKPMFWQIIRLTNTINKDRPAAEWIPYEIPAEFQP